MIIITAFYLFFLALIFALLEIEIEGKYGWAEKLPTWYKRPKLFSRFNIKKPLTGYHLFLITFTLALVHLVFFVGLSWTFSIELKVLAYYALFTVGEDFLWFVFNPHFELKNFKKNKVWWHQGNKWIFNLFPQDYITSIVFTVALLLISSLLSLGIYEFYSYLYLLMAFLIFVFLASVIFAPYYKRWYYLMRKDDQRKKFKIFH